MELFHYIFFYISLFIIFWGMIGYSLSIKVLGRLYKYRKTSKDYNYEPSVTIMVVAHNEEKVIYEKLNNIVRLVYPKDKIKFIVASDNSTDKTNEIVENFILENPDENIKLYRVKKRMGKTNAQNEAQKLVNTDYLVMTDANSMLDYNSVKELMASFTSEDICYVTGRLAIVNEKEGSVSKSESSYWSKDLRIREIESKIQTITAGNGAIYACRNSEYYDFEPLKSHDSNMPRYYALKGKKAICNHDAIAYEKAGEVINDEFKRKVRMNRRILKNILPDIRILNIFKYKWYSYFYFGHRTCRYLLWISHILLFMSNAFLIVDTWFYLFTFVGQVLFYFLAVLKAVSKVDNKYLNIIYYYCVTIIAQWVGVYNMLTGKVKPFWDKAESTR
ncbi:Glycosyltransferase, catalytic subunit of cellulose synthase and poly-beta-1,6-N-acetylglucosamine synthase [Virgibacillus subterraneus]|uniref:Glycosyltransferase, catalytic subunit of cellulose synthase and poly-beta-1,6-N-acetylglucosamine synthase n=1 Tax=Virgibacillus subterraneus TaxID=621109 RepID=A0A1H9AHX8_9BACI|nr:glycosyltransferase family 2 protein [Virgibacillus subterraneus]SEP76087.1 Glycosyltransferase, catalytic subunit of cellulose synthase and poly-beta-1,6-N-acetylglucosamine synthase [Virgibacillus subterraneus]